MDHHRAVLGVVLAGVGEPEALRHRVVELHRAELPGAPDRVRHVQVDLRPVEGAVARVELVGQPAPLQRGGERGLGLVPHLVRADAVVRPGRELQPRLEAEEVVDVEAEVQAADDLVLDLLGQAEDVGVVLRDVPDAQQAVEGAARLVAVHEPRLGVADRQVAVGAPLVREELHVRRAVHGLEAHGPVLDVREVHVVAVLVPVPALLEEVDVVEDRRLDLAVAAAAVLLAPELGQGVPDDHPRRLPERRPGRDLAEHEQPELAAELAVVARPRLLEQPQVLVELLLLEEGRAVDAGEHRPARIAAPVRAGDRLERERADPARRRARAGRGRGR